MSAWCVVNTLPNQELRAESNLLRQGFRAWLPFMRKLRRHSRRVHIARAPLFPGYIFVELDLASESWVPINGTYGVKRLLARGMAPERLPDGFVDNLRRSVGGDGACALAGREMTRGARVRILEGPFADCVAVIASFASGERVRLLLEILGGKVVTTMPRFAVAREA
jgi:transcription elongation factor/antiterminator RfaH